MASFIFTKIPSKTDNRRYTVRESRMGEGLGRKPQLTAEQMTTVTQGVPRNWPRDGTDKRAPVLPQDVHR